MEFRSFGRVALSCAVAAAPLALGFASTAPASAADPCGKPHNPFYGKVLHVSAQNIKVESASGKVCSFIYTPHVSQVRLGHGGTKMAQQKAVIDGDFAQVQWKTFVGIRHATQIVDSSYPLNVQKQ